MLVVGVRQNLGEKEQPRAAQLRLGEYVCSLEEGGYLGWWRTAGLFASFGAFHTSLQGGWTKVNFQVTSFSEVGPTCEKTFRDHVLISFVYVLD